jgi:hypothetical protein
MHTAVAVRRYDRLVRLERQQLDLLENERLVQRE